MVNMQMVLRTRKVSQSSTTWKLQRECGSKKKLPCISTSPILLASSIMMESSWQQSLQTSTSSSLVLELDSLDLCKVERTTWMPSRRATIKLLFTICLRCPRSETWELFLSVDSCLFTELWLEPPTLSQNSSWVTFSAWSVTNMYRTSSNSSSTLNQRDALTRTARTRVDGSSSLRTPQWSIGRKWEFKSTLAISQPGLCQGQSMLYLEEKSLIWPSQETKLCSLVSS